MTTRKKPTPLTETDVLTRSRRRCCICFGLSRDIEIKRGQIAHLDWDRSNSSEENLAFLCFDHHDQYDSRTSQSKNFTISEVKKYREELYEHVLPIIEAGTLKQYPVGTTPTEILVNAGFNEQQRQELKEIVLEVFADTAGPLRNLSGIAHRLRISQSTVEGLLFQLAQEGIIRVDRRQGTTQKTYSLASSLENRLIDTFVATLGHEVKSDDRYVRRQMSELDSVIKTVAGTTYAVETMLVRNSLTRTAVEARLDRLAHAKSDLGIEGATSVLLIGITAATTQTEEDLAALENAHVVIRYIELEEKGQVSTADACSGDPRS